VETKKRALLVLEDGTSFEGVSTGTAGERIGEVVLNTAVVGYQETVTDPANAGKIIVLTYPLIGNYGVAKKFYESRKCWIAGLAIKESSRTYSNWQAEGSLEDFLKKEGVVAMSDIDTRTLAVKIRDDGQMLGIISTKTANISTLTKKIKEYKKNAENDFIKDISVKNIAKIDGSVSGPNIAILDLGITNSILRQLKTLGCNITLMPYDTEVSQILALKPDGLIISNGPENDEAIPAIVETTKELLGKIPILGISTGHEVIALALGGKLKKMKIGHHGVNYPVKPPDSYKGNITVQNHSFVVDEHSLKAKGGIAVTLRNINDGSIEEMESRSLKFISTQYYPSSPGLDEVNEVFKAFLKMAAATGTAAKKHVSLKYNEVAHAKA